MIKKPPKTKPSPNLNPTGLNKKASERVPRASGYGGGASSLSRANEDKKSDLNPRAYLDIPLSNKPNDGDPKHNIKKTQ